MMKKNKFNIGDMLVSDCGDYGLVIKTGPRPDTPKQENGYYAYWTKEGFAFWLSDACPGISRFTN